MRARGLKLCSGQAIRGALLVAPHAGAWIETAPGFFAVQLMPRRAPCGRVD